MSDSRVQVENFLRRHVANPFLVLDVPVDASAERIERQGQKLLLLLSAGVAEGKIYPSPLGARERTAEMVREALVELRDPDRRLIHEFWAEGLKGK